MAYCPKCGVELENSVRNCPLCEFPIPNIEGMEEEREENKYPEAINIYKKVSEELKYHLFFLLLFIGVCGLAILATISSVFETGNAPMYMSYGILAIILYSFFLLMFRNWMINILGTAFTTGILLFNITEVGGYTWFSPLALPLVIWCFFVIFIATLLYQHIKMDAIKYIPTYILLSAGTMCIGIDGIISLYFQKQKIVSWSIIVFVSCVAFAVIAAVITHIVPNRVKERLNRKLHM